MSDPMFSAPPVSRADLERLAGRARRVMGVKTPHLPVAELLEFAFPALQPEFTWEVRTREELGSRHGAVDPHEKLLMLREDVYNGMVEGKGRDRFTVCHEIAHALLHTGVTLNRVRSKPRPFECPEWQANTFASAILMPEDAVARMRSVWEVIQVFGVSQDAAEVRLRKMNLRLPQIHLT